MILKYIWKLKGARIANIIMGEKKGKKLEDITLQDLL